MIISKNEFLAKNTKNEMFINLIKQAVLNKYAIQINISDNNVFIEHNIKQNCTLIRGASKIEHLNLKDQTKNIFTPFLLNYQSLIISTKNFYLFPNHYRSIADFFFRNLSICYLIGENVDIDLISKSDLIKSDELFQDELNKIIFWDYRKKFSKIINKDIKMDYKAFLYLPYFSNQFMAPCLLKTDAEIINKLIIDNNQSKYCEKLVNYFVNERDVIKNLKFRSI